MALEKQINIVVKETGLDAVQKQVNKLDNSLEDLSKTNSNVVKSMSDSSNAVLDNGGAMGLLNDATGGLAMTVKDAVEASVLFTKSQKLASIQQAVYSTVVGTSTGAMKLFRIALVATGIGALVVGLGLLIANFDKVKKVVLNLIPGLALVSDFVIGIVENITDFIGVTSEAERALADLTAQAERSNKINEKFLAEEGDRINGYTRQKIEAKKRYNDEVVKDGASQTKLAERLNRELIAIEQKHNDDLAKERQSKQDKIDEENKNLSEKAKAERLKAQEDIIKERDEYLKKANEFQEEQDAINLEKKQKEKEQEKKDFDEGLQKQLEKAQAQSEVANNSAEEEKRINEQKIKDEEQVRDAKFQIANSVFDLVNMFAKKGSKLAKGVAVAQATMSTYQGITNAFSAPSTVPEPFGMALRIANASVIGASGFANVKNILATNESGTGGGGQSSGTPSVSAPSFNLVQGTGTNQIAQGLSQQGAPIKAYVVSSDVSTSQSLDRNIVSEASLG